MKDRSTPHVFGLSRSRNHVAPIAFIAAVFVLGVTVALLPKAAALPIGSAVAAGLLYILSHLLRAIRLAILSVDMLGLSARTTVLMHFATVPISLALPLKIGEMARLYELWRLSGTLVYSVVVLLVDRMYDSLFLVPLLAILLFQFDASASLVVLTCAIAFLPLTVIVVGPRLMKEIQRYVVIRHNNPDTVKTLRRIDAVRCVVTRAAVVARQQAPTIIVLSLLVWFLEVLICLIIVNAIGIEPSSAFSLLGSRLTATWWIADPDPIVQAVVALALIVMLLPWPWVIALYIRRRRSHMTARSTGLNGRRRASS